MDVLVQKPVSKIHDAKLCTRIIGLPPLRTCSRLIALFFSVKNVNPNIQTKQNGDESLRRITFHRYHFGSQVELGRVPGYKISTQVPAHYIVTYYIKLYL